MFSYVLCAAMRNYELKQFVRFERISNLFYDESLDDPLEIACDGISLKIEFKDGEFDGVCQEGGGQIAVLHGDYSNLRLSGRIQGKGLEPFKYYKFGVGESFSSRDTDFLLPPSGDNLLSLLMANRELRSVVNQPFMSMGLRLGLRPQEGKLEVIKQVDDVIVSHPYSLTSETLQRLTFYSAAIMSNKSSVLVFEEPESHAFPYYAKYLAEMIALDDQDNQYFISTHNPYFLLPLLEKSPKADLAVHITYYDDYQTKTRELTQEEMEGLGEMDIFSNLEMFLNGG